jgi:uncharacterized protein
LKHLAYLDIETTGLSRDCSDLTVIGVATTHGSGLEARQLVGGQITAEAVLDLLKGVERIYTYNGSRFDLPFIKARLGLDLRRQFAHTDLMYNCWQQNLKGGLKVVEVKLGIQRQLSGVDGFMAVRLWWNYVNYHNQEALSTLLEYNREDVLNLHVLREKLGVDD